MKFNAEFSFFTLGMGSSNVPPLLTILEQVTIKVCCFPLDSRWPMMMPVHCDPFDPSAKHRHGCYHQLGRFYRVNLATSLSANFTMCGGGNIDDGACHTPNHNLFSWGQHGGWGTWILGLPLCRKWMPESWDLRPSYLMMSSVCSFLNNSIPYSAYE
jgi:hypothetical protein